MTDKDTEQSNNAEQMQTAETELTDIQKERREPSTQAAGKPKYLNSAQIEQVKKAVQSARRVLETAISEAIMRYDVFSNAVPEFPPETANKDIAMRNKLRTFVRVLGTSVSETSEGNHKLKSDQPLSIHEEAAADANAYAPLIEALSYTRWHQVLFGRCLLENDLLGEIWYGESEFDDIELKVFSLADYVAKAQIDLSNGEVYCEYSDNPHLFLDKVKGPEIEYDDKEGWRSAIQQIAEDVVELTDEIFESNLVTLKFPLPESAWHQLADIITDIPRECFDIDSVQDTLSWAFEFWNDNQREAMALEPNSVFKEDVRILTQRRSDPQYIEFVLDNTLGARWTNRYLGEALKGVLQAGGNVAEVPIGNPKTTEAIVREIVERSGVELPTLRLTYYDPASSVFVNPLTQDHLWPMDVLQRTTDRTPRWWAASGLFPTWFDKEFRVIDPFCGSGQMLVGAFKRLVAIFESNDEMLETLGVQYSGRTEGTIEKVLREKIFGMDIDRRAVEMTKFALTFAAWTYPNRKNGKRIGWNYISLQIVCSGSALPITKTQWGKIINALINNDNTESVASDESVQESYQEASNAVRNYLEAHYLFGDKTKIVPPEHTREARLANLYSIYTVFQNTPWLGSLMTLYAPDALEKWKTQYMNKNADSDWYSHLDERRSWVERIKKENAYFNTKDQQEIEDLWDSYIWNEDERRQRLNAVQKIIRFINMNAHSNFFLSLEKIYKNIEQFFLECNDAELRTAVCSIRDTIVYLQQPYQFVLTDIPHAGKQKLAYDVNKLPTLHPNTTYQSLSTACLSRCFDLCRKGEDAWRNGITGKNHFTRPYHFPGTVGAITSQNWLFSQSDKAFRTLCLTDTHFHLLARLPKPKGIMARNGGKHPAILIASPTPDWLDEGQSHIRAQEMSGIFERQTDIVQNQNRIGEECGSNLEQPYQPVAPDRVFFAIDASNGESLKEAPLKCMSVAGQLRNPDAVISLEVVKKNLASRLCNRCKRL